ncbi:MAG: hypothetical protein S0880_33940 [Actinomycetota bacterium]|nr:hypothetical protein [Actinomycetota bacterium]
MPFAQLFLASGVVLGALGAAVLVGSIVLVPLADRARRPDAADDDPPVDLFPEARREVDDLAA